MSQPPSQPYAEQPPSGQPGVPAPSAPGGPGYPPAAGGFPPPAGQGFGDAPPAGQGLGPAPKKRSVWKIVAIVVATVVVLCIGGIGIAVFANRDKIKDVAAATKIRVVEPAKLGTRAKANEPTINGGLQSDITEMKKDPSVTATVGALYGDAKKLDLVMVEAASSVGGSAQDRYNALSKNLNEFGITALKDVDPGPFGGIAKCGDGKAGSIPLGVCVWADSGSFAMIVQFNKTGADLQKDFVSYRGQIEQKI